MSTFVIRQGRDIKLKGAAAKEVIEKKASKQVCVQPPDFRGLKPKLTVKVGDKVKVGTPLFHDKNYPEIQIVSPASGTVSAINRGAKRSLQQIVVDADGQPSAEEFKKFNQDEIGNLFRDQVIDHLRDSGLWPVLRERPFSRVAHPPHKPKSIFVQGMNTEPLAPDFDVVMEGQEEVFQTGLNIIKHLTEGTVHLCIAEDSKSKALTGAKNVDIHRFKGPHPAGNVSTHIHHVDPINKGDIVWYVGAWDVVRIAKLFLDGKYPTEKFVVVTGEGVDKAFYAKTQEGAALADLIDGGPKAAHRYLSGSILAGKNVGYDGYVCFYDAQITMIPEGGERELLGWIMPGVNKYSFSKTFVSSFLPEKESSLHTSVQGSDRTIVLNGLYDTLVPLDIMTYFLIRAVIAGDIDEAEQLGILECDEEDFALCSFACPSKTDVGAIIRHGLDLIEKEG